MVGSPWPYFLAGLPLWFGPALLLLAVLTRLRVVRYVGGAVLVVLLALLYAVTTQWWVGPALPTDIEAMVLYGPTTLVICGCAWLVDHVLSRRRVSPPAAEARWPRLRPWLVSAFVVWSACCGGCVAGPMGEFLDLRLDSPDSALVLPLPEGLTLESYERGCGSMHCGDKYWVSSPDQVSRSEVLDRLWAHLLGTKGWERVREDRASITPGWFFRHEMCIVIDNEGAPSSGRVKVRTSGALACD